MKSERRGFAWCRHDFVFTLEQRKDGAMWSLIVFTFATSGAASGTVTTLEFGTQQLCLIAARELQALTEPITSEGLARYKVAATCVQTSEVTKK
jgi:hypothetical protein